MTTSNAQEPITLGGLTVRYLVDGAATQGMGVFELTIAPGANVPPPHSHTYNEECIYALEGRIRYAVDGVVRDLAPGEWMHTPKGAVHAFSNPHGETAKALVVLTPDVGAQYFRDVQALLGAGGPPDRQKLAAVMAEYGLVPSAPPAGQAPAS
jgi:quercetin dioxygenase-like cupin family protein